MEKVVLENKTMDQVLAAARNIGKEQRFPIPTRMALTDLKKTLAEQLEFLIEIHNDLVAEYGVKENGGPPKVPKDAENREEYESRRKELWEGESEIEVEPIPISLLYAGKENREFGEDFDLLYATGLIVRDPEPEPEPEEEEG